jgi:signal transduction histidine kinase
MTENKKKNRILIVDDDPMNSLILEEMLGTVYDLRVAVHESDALKLCAKFQPDLILLDLMIQFADGYEICKKLKSNKKSQFTKIILISSKALLKDRLFGYEAGADDYLSKPYDRDELLAKVRIFIRLKSVEEIDRAKDDLINIFSHETRTPLNAIIGFAKLLKDSTGISDEEQEFVDLILESGLSLLNLSNKAILLSNLKKGKMELQRKKILISDILDAACAKIPQSLKHKNIALKNQSAGVGAELDPKLIQTALSYLLDNAYRFSPRGSSVTVSAGIDNKQNKLFITVSDSGPGIQESRLDSLFDEFGIEDVAHHGRGHGLSLAIVKHIMNLYGGKVIAGNNPDKGCSITLLFPEKFSV